MTEERAKSLVRVLDIYVELPEVNNSYTYNQSNDFQKIDVSFNNDMDFSVSAYSARLEQLMLIPNVKAHFISNSYATDFNNGKHILTPVVFHNIYKGALGEEVGKFILEEHLKIELEELSKEHYERFDFKVKDKDVYIDFKHWQEYTSFDASTTKEKILQKLDGMKGDRIIVINILAVSDYRPIETLDGRIVEIANLFDVERKDFNQDAIEKIMRNV